VKSSLPILFVVLLSACGSRPSSEAMAPSSPPVTAPPTEHVDGAISSVERADVVKVIDGGMGRFLQDAEVEVAYEDGRYLGYRIVRILNVDRYRGVGLEPGDIIMKINGASIEREGDAYDVFQSLRTAPYIEVDYQRAGEAMRLSLPIVGEIPAVSPEPPKVASPAPASGDAASPSAPPKSTPSDDAPGSSSSPKKGAPKAAPRP
jgi:hypothetical protein